MKKFNSEKLNSVVFIDAEKTKTIDNKNLGKHTVASYLLFLLNEHPVKELPLTRDRLKKIKKIEESFSSQNIVLDDAEHTFLVDYFDKAGIVNRYLYEQVIDCLDTAEDYKA